MQPFDSAGELLAIFSQRPGHGVEVIDEAFNGIAAIGYSCGK